MKSYLDALPTTNVKALGTTAHHGRSYSGHTFNGYTSELCNEKDITNETYIKIKEKVDEITYVTFRLQLQQVQHICGLLHL